VLRTVLIDVGGTLWPNTWPTLPEDQPERVNRLRSAVPALTDDEAAAIVAALSLLDHPASQKQLTDQLVSEVLQKMKRHLTVPVSSLRAAMCLPAYGRVEPFPGAKDLLAGLAERGAQVVVVSNTMWRDDRAHLADFGDLGLSEYVDAYVSSVDVGWRKPHSAFFDMALRAAGHTPDQCAIVGDTEANDIEPARARGMLAVRVAIEESLPSQSAADHVCESLQAVAGLLFARLASGRTPR
jgi:HAD superfamily hydrolase (TIGR01509 family)